MLEAAALLRSQKRVLITGIGASMFASVPLEYALCAQGIDATLIEAAELLHYRHNAYRDALWIVVSRSGESIEIKRLLEIAANRQTVIGVTNEPESQLARQANVTLLIGSQPDEMVAIQTYTGTLLALHILLRLMHASPDAVSSEIQGLLPRFAAQVKMDLEHQRDWDAFLEPPSPMALLARGPAMASALEGALLFNEIAKFPAFATPMASFRHGPIEVADAKFRGVLFASGEHTRELNIALGEELTRFGATVRMVGSSGGLYPALCWHETPQTPEDLAPLFDIVPLQVAATRLAELQGIWPGSFRYTPQVAVDEARFNAPPGGSHPPNR
jgi:glucosamine--fructose-6-phosphate aminotransferase (isomerizing)